MFNIVRHCCPTQPLTTQHVLLIGAFHTPSRFPNSWYSGGWQSNVPWNFSHTFPTLDHADHSYLVFYGERPPFPFRQRWHDVDCNDGHPLRLRYLQRNQLVGQVGTFNPTFGSSFPTMNSVNTNKKPQSTPSERGHLTSYATVVWLLHRGEKEDNGHIIKGNPMHKSDTSLHKNPLPNHTPSWYHGRI